MFDFAASAHPSTGRFAASLLVNWAIRSQSIGKYGAIRSQSIGKLRGADVLDRLHYAPLPGHTQAALVAKHKAPV
jgi:hypothetical protein